jgi:hypothetical protein
MTARSQLPVATASRFGGENEMAVTADECPSSVQLSSARVRLPDPGEPATLHSKQVSVGTGDLLRVYGL